VLELAFSPTPGRGPTARVSHDVVNLKNEDKGGRDDERRRPMPRLTTRGAALVVVAATCTLAGSAFGYATSRIVIVKPGDGANFPLRSGPWACNNRTTTVRCFSGDAFPNVELTGTRRGGVTVRVRMLGGAVGTVKRTRDKSGRPLYVFTAS